MKVRHKGDGKVYEVINDVNQTGDLPEGHIYARTHLDREAQHNPERQLRGTRGRTNFYIYELVTDFEVVED